MALFIGEGCNNKIWRDFGMAGKTAPAQDHAHKNFKAKAITMFWKVVIATVYLWILFALFNLYKTALLNEHGIDYWDQGFAFFSALVFSKVLLVGDMLGIGQSLRKRALVWVVLGRSLIFAVLIILCHAGLSVIRAWYDAQPVMETIMKIGGGSWLGFWIYAAILFFMLIPLAAFRELSFVLGENVIWKLMTSSEQKV